MTAVTLSLDEIRDRAVEDLTPHVNEFDAIVVGFDSHATAIGAVIAAALKMPLLIVHMRPQTETMSNIVPIGAFHPNMRTLYVDDWFKYGATLAQAMAYMCQSEHPTIVATYEATLRDYRTLTVDDIRQLIRAFGHRENVWGSR